VSDKSLPDRPNLEQHTKPLSRDVTSLDDAASRFIHAACSPRHGHRSGRLEEAEMILARRPHVAASGIYTAAILGDEATVRAFLARDPASATAKGGPLGWDALTHLCFSRYLRLDHTRSEAFVRTAQALLDAGASPNTGWIEIIDYPNPRPVLEAAIYGAAAVAQHAGLTRLLLERGADPNRMTGWGLTALHQSVRRDNRLPMIELLLDHGADPAIPNREGKSAIWIAAHRGRADILELLERRGIAINLSGVDALIVACARDQKETIRSLVTDEPQLKRDLAEQGGTLLAEFSGVGNLAGIRNLLNLGVSVTALYREGDAYYGVAKDSTALHVAAWRARPGVVKELIAHGAPVNALDGQGRTALQLAVKACVDSFWTELRSPEAVRALLEAGSSIEGIELPTGYDEIEKLLRYR
jgi:ankyrin repeat protein